MPRPALARVLVAVSLLLGPSARDAAGDTLVVLNKSEATARMSAGLAPGSAPVGILVAPGGARAYVAHTAADVVVVFDVASGAVVKTLTAGREPDGMAWSTLPVKPH